MRLHAGIDTEYYLRLRCRWTTLMTDGRDGITLAGHHSRRRRSTSSSPGVWSPRGRDAACIPGSLLASAAARDMRISTLLNVDPDYVALRTAISRHRRRRATDLDLGITPIHRPLSLTAHNVRRPDLPERHHQERRGEYLGSTPVIPPITAESDGDARGSRTTCIVRSAGPSATSSRCVLEAIGSFATIGRDNALFISDSLGS